MITSNVAFYPCRSIEETQEFYGELLGLATVFSRDKVRIFDTVKGHFGFVEYQDKEVAQGRLCLSLNVASQEEVEKFYQTLIDKGIEIDGRPAYHPNQPVYSFFLKDPSGYLVEIQKIDDLVI